MGIMRAIKPNGLIVPDGGKRPFFKLLDPARPYGLGDTVGCAGPCARKCHKRQSGIVDLMLAS